VTGNKRHRNSCGSAGVQSGVVATFHVAIILFVLSALLPVYAQQNGISKNGSYNISGDNVYAETDDSGTRHLKADGNVHLTYVTADSTWQLSADAIEYVEKTENKIVIVQTAEASGNVEIAGPGIAVTTPGNVSVDILAGKLVCDGDSIHATFENGEITTSHLEITMVVTPEGKQQYTVDTSVHTTGSYTLTKEYLPGVVASGNSQSSLFGALDFDFAEINLDTTRTTLLIVDGDPVRLDCPEPSVITSASNKLTLPSCGITFNPTVLSGADGVQIDIGEAEVVIKAGSFRFSYPPEGGMYMELSCSPTAPSGTDNAVDPAVCMPDRVTITHGTAVFYADVLTVRVTKDGAKRVEASGNTKLETTMGELMQSGDGGK
jgi:hypothetical protein